MNGRYIVVGGCCDFTRQVLGTIVIVTGREAGLFHCVECNAGTLHMAHIAVLSGVRAGRSGMFPMRYLRKLEDPKEEPKLGEQILDDAIEKAEEISKRRFAHE